MPLPSLRLILQRLAILALASINIGPVLAQPRAETNSATATSAPALADNILAFHLYPLLAKAPDHNVFFSPYSISTTLTMTWAGARGDTATQLAQALGLGSFSPAQMASASALWQKNLNEPEVKSKGKLLVANSLWPRQDHAILPDYSKLIQDNFAAAITPVDYKTQAETVAQTINTWVEDKTEKHIQDLLHPGDIASDTRLILVNAIYFKGMWTEKFDPAHTAPGPFTLANGTQKSTDFMHKQMETARLAEVAEPFGSLQLLALPYQGSSLEFVVVLPKSSTGLPALEKNLSPALFTNWLAKLSVPREVEVTLPKFKLSQRSDLVAPLRILGITDAFTDRADFSGMDGAHDLYIGGVIHQAYVEVNEEGTEAAAATGVIMRPTLAQVIPEFRADHPFLFFIRDSASGGILFMGRYATPE